MQSSSWSQSPSPFPSWYLGLAPQLSNAIVVMVTISFAVPKLVPGVSARGMIECTNMMVGLIAIVIVFVNPTAAPRGWRTALPSLVAPQPTLAIVVVVTISLARCKWVRRVSSVRVITECRGALLVRIMSGGILLATFLYDRLCFRLCL